MRCQRSCASRLARWAAVSAICYSSRFVDRLRARAGSPVRGVEANSSNCAAERPVRVRCPARCRASSTPKNRCWALERAGMPTSPSQCACARPPRGPESAVRRTSCDLPLRQPLPDRGHRRALRFWPSNGRSARRCRVLACCRVEPVPSCRSSVPPRPTTSCPGASARASACLPWASPRAALARLPHRRCCARRASASEALPSPSVVSLCEPPSGVPCGLAARGTEHAAALPSVWLTRATFGCWTDFHRRLGARAASRLVAHFGVTGNPPIILCHCLLVLLRAGARRFADLHRSRNGEVLSSGGRKATVSEGAHLISECLNDLG